jgi:Domain of unknown function (DUF5680)
VEDLIVRAKIATYVAHGPKAESSRPGAYDLVYEEGLWSYRDSFFGDTDFVGQEVIWFEGKPVWSMCYCGYITRDDLIDSHRAGQTVKAARTEMYREGRFLGAHEWHGPHGVYRHSSDGGYRRFTGAEDILVGGAVAYHLDYFGGSIRS